MSHSTFDIHKNHTLLVAAVHKAVELSNTHHGKPPYDLANEFAALLCQAKGAWQAILSEIDEIVAELPQHEFVSHRWIQDYQRLAVSIADGIALLVCAQYARGRGILEAEYIPLQNAHAQVANTLWQYEHA